MRRITFSEGEFYHIYNRGVDKRKVFTTPTEYKRFLLYLYLLNDTETKRLTYTFRAIKIDEAKPRQEARQKRKPSVAIGAFCLMPNHFHIYATPLVDGGISRFMQRLQTAYTMYFNERHERSGALFRGTFKAEHASNDAYAKYLFSYIHLNPAAIKDSMWKDRGPRDLRKLRDFIRGYPYSSAGEYLSRNHLITDPSKFPEYFANEHDVDDHIDSWLEYGKVKGLASQI